MDAVLNSVRAPINDVPRLNHFTQDPWQSLSRFGLRPSQQDVSLVIDASRLLDDQLCLAALEKAMPATGAPNIKMAASLLLKRIAFLTLAPMLYAMSCYDKGLDVGAENCVFQYAQEEGRWCSTMALKQLCMNHASGSRAAWREQWLHKAFAGHLTRLVEQFHRLTRVSKPILWENIAIRVFSIYERRVLKTIPEERQAIAQQDFAFLLDQNTTELFGMPNNPIAEFYFDMSQVPHLTAPVRVRRTCCYYYRATEPAQYCDACPLLQKGKRALT